MRKTGKRFSVWLPQKYEWMAEALDQLVEECEMDGEVTSKSEVIRDILEPSLKAALKRRNDE